LLPDQPLLLFVRHPGIGALKHLCVARFSHH
jgi:hypothetical protein